MAKKDCAEYLTESQDEGDVLREMIGTMLHEVMEEEVCRQLGAGRHERSSGRQGYRNGRKPRTLHTRVGALELSVPQTRGAEPYHPSFFSRWQRSERALLTACAEMYFMGVSTRKVGAVLEKMGGFSLSAATVSKVASELDEQLTEFRQRRLDEHTWPYLMVDATYVKVRDRGKVRSRAVLVVAGINDAGSRDILTWRLGSVESEDTWAEVFTELRQRGVRGVEYVISDGHQGIQAAAAKQFDGAQWQRCWTHFIRGALAKVSNKHNKAVAGELRAAWMLEDEKLCLAEAERIATMWEGRYPKLARQIREQFEETMTVHHLPSQHRRRVYTTNMIERVMAEIKRRTRVVGIFPNNAACDRLVGAHLLERDETWKCERTRYLVMDHLETEKIHINTHH